MNAPDWQISSTFLFLAMLTAGITQTVWMTSKLGKRTAIPIDGGRQMGGHRILGDNKTWRGFIVMVPACGVSFMLWHRLFGVLYKAEVLWPLSPLQYFLLGATAGFAFMLAELPNSFFKRRAGVAPGKAAQSRSGRCVCFFIDQVDSIVGSLLAVSLFVPLSFGTWVLLVVVGGVAHLSFNLILRKLGLRKRAA
jgi:CDP-2,3-bis-(O-geranylgeranyl)-sn-glycerol synthase